MQLTTYYVLRSQQDGRYLTARLESTATEAPAQENTSPPQFVSFLLLFQEHFEALSYLSAHAPDLRDRFGVEGISSRQLRSLLDRWGFAGVGIVRDPLVPQVEFLTTPC